MEMIVLKGCNFQDKSGPVKRLQTFINDRVDSERVATFLKMFLFYINTIYSSKIFLLSFSDLFFFFFCTKVLLCTLLVLSGS